jgi:hypothetical protein
VNSIRYDVAFDEYMGLPGEHYSSIKEMHRSPNHYLSSVRPADSDAMRVGRAIHSYVLDPGNANVVQFDGRRAGKLWDEFKAAHVGSVILKPSDLQMVALMHDSVARHPHAGALLVDGYGEITCQFEIDDIPFKARIDWLTSDGVLVELKTTRDVSPRAFEREYARRLYHAQAALYWMALRECNVACDEIRCIAVDKTAPYEVVVYRIGQDVIEAGARLVFGWIARLKECRLNGVWPGVDGGKIIDLRIPDWAFMEGLPDIELEGEDGDEG